MQKQELLQEITYLLGSIRDPQRCQTLSELQVILEDSVSISEDHGYKNLLVQIKPTVPHCHLVQQIGLSIHYKLMMELPDFKKMKLKIKCFQNTHQQAEQVEKQINDKERIAAALQNEDILKFIASLTQEI